MQLLTKNEHYKRKLINWALVKYIYQRIKINMTPSSLPTTEWRKFSKSKMSRNVIFIHQFCTNNCSGVVVLKILVFTTTTDLGRLICTVYHHG